MQALENFDPSADFDTTGERVVWYAQPELLFACSLCRAGHQEDFSSHTQVSLVFFSTFEPIALSPDHVMQAEKEVPMLYKNSERDLPTLYVCLQVVGNVLGRVPLTPCYTSGNTHPTIPYCFRGQNLGGAKADSRQDNGTGSKLFEVNIRLWRYGQSLPRKHTVSDATKTERA